MIGKYFLIGFLLGLSLTGCRVLKSVEPNTLPIEITHVSHLTQHEPFTASPTDYGYNALSVGAKWHIDPHVTVTISEGLVLDHQYTWSGTKVPNATGALLGPREVFTARIVYEIPLR